MVRPGTRVEHAPLAWMCFVLHGLWEHAVDVVGECVIMQPLFLKGPDGTGLDWVTLQGELESWRH